MEKLQTRMEVCEGDIYGLNTMLEEKEEKSKRTAEEIEKIEAKERLNKLLPKIEETANLVKGKTPALMLNQHYIYLTNELAQVEQILTLNAASDVMEKINAAKANLSQFNLTISQLQEQQFTQDKVLEYTLTPPTNDDDDKNKN